MLSSILYFDISKYGLLYLDIRICLQFVLFKKKHYKEVISALSQCVTSDRAVGRYVDICYLSWQTNTSNEPHTEKLQSEFNISSPLNIY